MTAQTDPVVDSARDGDVTETIVTSVAELRGVDPRELDPPLHAFVDPDALDSLFRSTDGEWRGDGASHVEFHMFGCHVLLRDTGQVVVTRDPGDAGAASA